MDTAAMQSVHGSTATNMIRPGFPLPPGVPVTEARLERRTVFDDASYSVLDTSFDVDGAAARVVAAYDRDSDGALDMHSGGILDPGELMRFDDEGVGRSIARLAKEADRRGNGDGRVTVEEIANVIRSFDHAHGPLGFGRVDGELDGDERVNFLAAYGEQEAGRIEPGPLMPIWCGE